MMDLLESNGNLVLASKADLAQLINASWYAEFDMINTRSGKSIFSTYQHIFNESLPDTYTNRHSEYNAYLKFKIMCEAIKTLINAEESKVSYIPSVVFSENTPNLWPKSFAIQTVTLEAQRAFDDSSMISWNDVTPITEFELLSNAKARYFSDSVNQEIEVLARVILMMTVLRIY